MKNKKHLLFWILFPIGWTLIAALLVFYFDLANGPLVFFILELVLLVAFFIVRTLFRNRKFLFRLFTWIGFLGLTVAFISFSQPTVTKKSAAYYSNPTVIAEPYHRIKTGCPSSDKYKDAFHKGSGYNPRSVLP